MKNRLELLIAHRLRLMEGFIFTSYRTTKKYRWQGC